MPKPSASTSIVANMASPASIDFDAIDHKNSIDEATRIRYQLNHAIHHIEQHYTDDPKNLATLRAHFENAERAAATRFGKQTVVGSSSTLKRKSSVGDLEISDDEEENEPLSKKKKQVKEPKEHRDNGLSGMNVFMNCKRTEVKLEGYGGADTMPELSFRWQKYTEMEKDAWQRIACVANSHHRENRAEVEKLFTNDAVNKELNRLWVEIMNDPIKLLEHIERWEKQDAKQRKVPVDEPNLLPRHEGPACPSSYSRTDGSVVDYTVEKTVKEGKNKGKVYTEQGNANLRYERMLVRKSKDENEASKILAGNALAGAADAPVASDAPDSPDDTVAA